MSVVSVALGLAVAAAGAAAGVGACTTEAPAAPQEPAPAASSACTSAYPTGPYGTREGDTLDDLSFDALDARAASDGGGLDARADAEAPDGGRDGNGGRSFALHEAFAPCVDKAPVLLLRVHAGFCGTCRWHAAHLGEAIGADLRARVKVVDLIVRDDDGALPSEADLVTWRSRQDAPAIVALDPEARLIAPRTSLPRVLVVDPRTMKIRAAMADPSPEALTDAIAAVVAEQDGRAAPPPSPIVRVDGRFDREQWDMLREMRLFGGGPPRDPTNRVADDDVAAELGRELFQDATLSPSAGVSCGRCHDAARAFADGSETATGGVGGADRNTPSIVLAGWSRWQLWDGRADTLWMQALLPMEDAREFGSSRLFIAHRLYDAYKSAYERSFGAMPPLAEAARFPPAGKPGDAAWEAMTSDDRDAVTQTFVNTGKAIAAFERSFRATELPFEAYVRGDAAALTSDQKDGIAAFFEAGCAQCHWGNRMTDDAFHVLRFPTGRHDLLPDRGRADGIPKLDASEFREDGRWSDWRTLRARSPSASVLGAFKTPALRGVAVTAPYGHGGSVPSLDMVVELHRTAGMPTGNRYTIGDAEPWLVDFPEDRSAAIVAFLSTLGLGFVR